MTLPRLLRGIEPESIEYEQHLNLHGHLSPSRAQSGLREEIRRAGLLGRGGGGFPLAIKLDAVRRAPGTPVLVVNGCEGDPLSDKDRVLLTHLPHLVIDGAISLARAVGAEEIRFTIDEVATEAEATLSSALDDRPELRRARLSASVVRVPSGYVSGQETALVHWSQRGVATPLAASPRVTERGIKRRPTLVSNAETVAHVALIALYGADWYVQSGTDVQPGSTLVTLSGAVSHPGVYEIEYGARLDSLLDQAGGVKEEIDSFLIGGCAGTWVEAVETSLLELSDAALTAVGARLGTGAIVAVPVSACPVAETARMARWLAGQSAGQCGPCVHGLAALANGLTGVCTGTASPGTLEDLERWCRLTTGRGACTHPDGTTRLVRSALLRYRDDLRDHLRHGPCDGCEHATVLTLPEPVGGR